MLDYFFQINNSILCSNYCFSEYFPIEQWDNFQILALIKWSQHSVTF